MKKTFLFLSVLMMVVFVNSAFAMVGIGGRCGLDMFQDDPPGDGLMFGGQLKLDIPLTPFSAELSGEYFSKDSDESFGIDEFGNPADVEITFNLVSVGATVKYDLGLLPLSPIKPYAGVGLGMHMIAYEIESDELSGTLPDDETKFGFHTLVGTDINIPMMPFGLFVEAKYTKIFVDNDDSEEDLIKFDYPEGFTSIYGGVNIRF